METYLTTGKKTGLVLCAALLLWPVISNAQTVTERRTAHFTMMDRNQDGVLDRAELSQAPWGNRHPYHIERMMARLDGNQDGRIAKEEFMAFTPPGRRGGGVTPCQTAPCAGNGPGWTGGGPCSR
ncbi:MAG: EF-hand domain-containing protein [Magnetococcales bacterium]|nr:EF-hand domain-containing protein [Magnetococcales bacterium]